jgi:hypothetical protein
MVGIAGVGRPPGSGCVVEVVVAEFEEVDHCGGEVEFAGRGGESAAAEPAESGLVFEVSDDGLDGG